MSTKKYYAIGMCLSLQQQVACKSDILTALPTLVDFVGETLTDDIYKHFVFAIAPPQMKLFSLTSLLLSLTFSRTAEIDLEQRDLTRLKMALIHP